MSLLFASLLAGCDGPLSASPDGGVPARLGVPDPDHDPSSDEDLDGDGVLNAEDNCPSLANADQRPICTYELPPPAPTGDTVEDGLSRLDFWRRQLGLGPVTEADAFSEGCRLHVAYLQQLSAELGSPQLGHEEDLSKPYASEEGNRAGVDSLLSMGQGSMADAVDGWINTLYHRLPLFHPGLTSVGLAYSAEGRYACLQYRRGTDSLARAPHPILWPPADIQFTDRQFGGSESPCPTIDDPLGGGACPPSAAIPTLGIHGWGALSDVTASFTRLDTMEEVPLYRVYWDGGPTPHEQSGYLEGTVSLVPEPESSLTRAPYEVRIDALLGGAQTTWRWRFHTQGGFNEDLPCELWDQGTFEQAIAVTAADIDGRICAQPDFFRIRDAGTWSVSLTYDPARGDLELLIYDEARALIREGTGPESPHRLEGVPGPAYIEVRGRDGQMSPYTLSIEPG